jgi:2-polyprenyl-6-hydroxyphenyl methylase/3-demethylubiquinone-9 3-methyltransferase
LAPERGYYDEKLAAEKLERCYEIAPPRIRQYLAAEMGHVLSHIQPGDDVLDLGCGYGRTLPQIAARARFVVGIDTSLTSLRAAALGIKGLTNCRLACMNAVRLGFKDCAFDLVVCIQNGISAFHVDPRELVGESLRVTRHGGKVLLSTYSEKFWADRLEWFELQSREGLLGEIDPEKTRNGVIVCRDGFRATTVTPAGFLDLAGNFDADVRITEADDSSLFCELSRRGKQV